MRSSGSRWQLRRTLNTSFHGHTKSIATYGTVPSGKKQETEQHLHIGQTRKNPHGSRQERLRESHHEPLTQCMTHNWKGKNPTLIPKKQGVCTLHWVPHFLRPAPERHLSLKINGGCIQENTRYSELRKSSKRACAPQLTHPMVPQRGCCLRGAQILCKRGLFAYPQAQASGSASGYHLCNLPHTSLISLGKGHCLAYQVFQGTP